MLHARRSCARWVPHAARLLTLLVVAVAPAWASAEPVLRVADQKGLQRALLDASGALAGATYRIAWSEFPAASPLLQALSADAVDTGIAGDGPFLFAYGAGQNVRATLAILPRQAGSIVAIVVPHGSPIRSAAALAGHSVATTKGSIGHELLLRLVQTGAVDGSKLHVVFLSPSEAASALRAGSVDAWATWEPYVSLEAAQGADIPVRAGTLLANYSFQVANRDEVTKKRALLADFYHRLATAFAWGDAHPDQFARIWSTQMGLPLAVATDIADRVRTHAAPITDAVITAERVTIETYRAGGVLPARTPPLAGAFDRSFAP